MPPFALDTLLAHAGFIRARATPIDGGWASWTFDVNGEAILRVASSPDIAATYRKEARLLPELASHVDFSVPRPRLGEYNGLVYMTYPKISGRAFRAGDDIDALADALRRLHSFPTTRAAELTDSAATGQAWREDHLAMWERIERDVLPILDHTLANRVRREYAAALEWLADIEPALIHRDLGCEHILCDHAGKPTGILDFETATVGDPVIDFIGVLNGLGPAVCEELIAAYGIAVPAQRLRFYFWMGSVHAIAYGLSRRDTKIIDDGVRGLRQRMTGDACG